MNPTIETGVAIGALLLTAYGIWLSFTVSRPNDKDVFTDEALKDLEQKRKENAKR